MLTYKIDEAIDLANKYINADTPFAFQGTHGIGKSLGLKKLADRLGIGFVDLRLTLFEEADLIGMPFREGNITSYSKPIWLKLIEDQNKDRGLLCLEELNRCDALVRQPALQLLWDRKCSHFNIPSGWLPIATWNPSGENYETQELDGALLSRLIVIDVVSDLNSWLTWAEGEKINSKIINFLRSNPKYFSNSAFKLTPRSWSIASTLVDKYPNDVEVLKPLLGLELALLLSKFTGSPADDLLQSFNLKEDISKEDIKKIIPKLMNQSPDHIMMFFKKLKESNENLAYKLLSILSKHSESFKLVERLNGITK